ncbi:alkaline phosphatase D family protein [Parendozoicomonas sp. Alg238-R29]|uniref:alkaline phosphatase D family protein n=1 Tax=Parendozoicomonas sp. Alg238-R29 TaxID=2993446 RepID=UPI00248DF869|nr:alkaline phosphatase D family protein [Parendozoicomonas sp. Alg238-R29]
MKRRNFLQALGVSLVTPFTVLPGTGSQALASFISSNRAPQEVFGLSVASGDPSATGVILWTRINPDQYNSFEPLYFEVALDEQFGAIVVQGQVEPKDFDALRDYTVNLDLDGRLESGRRYYYRFIYRGVGSRTGRCKTLPSENTRVDQLKFAVLTCQDYTTGYYNAFERLAEEDLDFVVHLGDFIYEYAAYEGMENHVRPIPLPSGEEVAVNLEDYRHLYRTYRSDPALQRAMEAHSWVLTWDDHEIVDNAYWDYENDTLSAPKHPIMKNGGSAADMRQLKLDSQKAWIEYIPARLDVNENTTHPHEQVSIYRSFKAGDLLEMFISDSRTYRTEQPCSDEGESWPECREQQDVEQSMLGQSQKQWIVDGITNSDAKWKFWGNQTMMAQLAITIAGRRLGYLNLDAWDGYQAERTDIMKAIKGANVDNFVVITGDYHTSLASYLKVDYRKISNWDYDNLVGAEFMTPSVTSPNPEDYANSALNTDGLKLDKAMAAALKLNNPHIKHMSTDIYGYAVVELDQDDMYWNVYEIDKYAYNPNAEKKLHRRYKYDPYWVNIKRKE